MKEYLEDYIKELDKIKKKDLSNDEKETFKQNLLVKIGFFQHERLIHLLVTIFAGLSTILFLLGFLLLENIFMGCLFLLTFLLFVPYILHYYFLENNVQKLYKYYDELNKKN